MSLAPRRARLLMCACLALSGAGAAVPAAHAGALDATCQGSVSSTFSPGLRVVAQTTAATDTTTLGTCVSTADPTLTSGSAFASYTASESCVSPINSGTITQVLRWSNGRRSTFTATAALTSVAGQSVATFTGTITAGLFAGDTAEEITISPALDPLSCLLGPGVTSRNGTATLAITSL